MSRWAHLTARVRRQPPAKRLRRRPVIWSTRELSINPKIPSQTGAPTPRRTGASSTGGTMAVSFRPLKPAFIVACLISLAGCAAMTPTPGKRELIVVGNDEKVGFSDAGAFVFSGPGKDTVSIIDIGTDPLAPKILVNLPLMNSIIGPPVNLAITPDESLALVANSMDAEKDGAGWKMVPDNKLYVIDLTTNPPALIDTVAVGKQPSGMSINRAGNLALIANRADNSISVLRIAGKKVTLIDTVTIGEQVAHVVFAPDGKRAMAGKFPGHKLALLEVNGEKVTYTKQDIPVGLWPYNFDIAPDGKLALSADNGAAGRSDETLTR
jgi:DNA-binding beta-propeller fold protein YncE